MFFHDGIEPRRRERAFAAANRHDFRQPLRGARSAPCRNRDAFRGFFGSRGWHGEKSLRELAPETSASKARLPAFREHRGAESRVRNRSA